MSDLPFPSFRAKICEKMSKKVTPVDVYCPHIEVKCLVKALIFAYVKKNILIYSQMRFQFYQSHGMIVVGLKSGKKSIN